MRTVATEPQPDPLVGEQFDDFDQQRRSTNQGVWVFLSSEVMLLGAAIAAYSIYRSEYAASFADGSRHLDDLLGTINTALLLISSAAMAMASHAVRHGARGRLIALLAIVATLGTAFLTIKGFEYAHAVRHDLVPGEGFEINGSYPDRVELFFGFYFVLTAVHAAHLLAGIGLVGWLALRVMRVAELRRHELWMGGIALYWHLVDVVWIWLFPLLYLVHPPVES